MENVYFFLCVVLVCNKMVFFGVVNRGGIDIVVKCVLILGYFRMCLGSLIWLVGRWGDLSLFLCLIF